MTALYEIGPFRLDARARVLTHAGVPVALGSRGAAVLTALVERANEHVAKAILMDAAWPDVVVEESNLAVQISAIRRVLALAPGGDRWVETLARRGYRFVGPVTALPDAPPQGAAAKSSRTNLPEPLTSFVGREREIVEIKRLLPGCRLLTLVGIGGIGKTRLALQVAAEATDAYRDGVWFVELAPLVDPALVPSAVAQVLGVSEATGKPLLETLCSRVKARQLLLLLDNCEHLLDACARLADAMLRSAAELTIIATSREPLHVAGEQTYTLPALSLPDPSAGVDNVRAAEAVQLFVERAHRHQPEFELTAAHAPAVAQLCIHLDGIPLALELAAARVRSLSIEQINARLDDRFKLLTGGTRTALPRQQTLRGTLDWSHGLLSEQERVVLRRLAIFVGGFTLEAAAAVVTDESIDEFTVTDLLEQLVSRSLVIADTNDAGARYRMLETTRFYALEKLAEAGEADAIKRRHATCFRDRFERAYHDWLRMSDAHWHAMYLPERDNVRVAIDWALGGDGDPIIGIALAGASAALWAELSLPGEGHQRLEAAIAQVESRTSKSDQARLWLWLGLLRKLSAPAQAVMALEQAVELYRGLGDVAGLSHSLSRQGAVLAKLGRFEVAARIMAEAIPALESTGLPKALGFYFSGLGEAKLLTGELAAARVHFEKALALYREAGTESAALSILVMLTDITWALGDLDAALAAVVESVARLRSSPLARKWNFGIALINLAGVRTERRELDEALAAAREGLPLLQEAAYAWQALDHLALRAALADKPANAARIAGYADSMHLGKESTRQPNEARARARLQALLHEKFDAEELQRLLAEGANLTDDEACRVSLEE
ncbi:MAG: winged helix-turn-helix domain-containing protein [Burkholderiales bacterium]